MSARVPPPGFARFRPAVPLAETGNLARGMMILAEKTIAILALIVIIGDDRKGRSMISRDRREKMAFCLRCWAIIILSLILLSCLFTCSTKNLLGIEKVGAIFVNSNPPGANITIDQTLTGKKTPDTVSDVPVGDHTVSVSLSGFVVSPESALVRVNEDQTDTVEFALLEADKGSLKVTSSADGATICIDKQPTDKITPHVFFNSVPIGIHTISVFKEGHSNQDPAKGIVTVTTRDTVEVDFTLNPATVGKDKGNITPDFHLQDDYGSWHRFYACRGFVTMIFFWATDCPGCMEELPYLQEIYSDYSSDTLLIFGINYGGDFGQEGIDVIRRVREDEGIQFTLLLGVGTSARSDFEVTFTPVTLILDRDGTIYSRNVAFADWYSPGKFRQDLDELFGK
jgi:thiol-disulfide isomerase/thioredoxin